MSLRSPVRVGNTLQKARIADGFSLPPAIGGLNARDALSNMDPKDALILNNWFPQPTYVELRKGHLSFATISNSDPVDTLMQYAGVTENKLFAAASSTIFNVTAGGSVASADVTGLANAKWQYLNFANAGGHFIWTCNGADTPLAYDGSVWSVLSTISAGVASVGFSASNFIYVTSFKNRIWTVQKDSLNAWYLGVNSITGLATKFPLSSIFQLGGHLIAIGTLSQDAGNGPDDYIAFVTSNGEVAIYGGTDPASDLVIVGRFTIGRPVPLRPLIQVGGDLFVLTDDGIISMIKALNVDKAAISKISLSNKINTLINQAVQLYRGNFGWQVFAYPRGNWAIVNVPVSENETQTQFIMNTITGAWSTFTGLNANCWCLKGDDLYFGGNAGDIYLADTGYTDNGAGIFGQYKSSFNYYGNRGTNKQVTMIRPVYRANGNPTILLGIDMDFANQDPGSNLDIPTGGSGWDEGLWDDAMWAGETPYTSQWRTVGGIGYCGAIRLNVLSRGQSMQVNSFDLQAIPGGPL
jgi:hypothetical protein